MNKIIRRLKIHALALVGLAILLPGASNLARAAECEDPDALRFSIIPTEETVQELQLYQPIVNHLSSEPVNRRKTIWPM